MLAGKDLSFAQTLIVSAVGILVVMFELAVLAVLVYLLSRVVRAAENKFASKQPSAQPAASAAGGTPLPSGTSAGELKLKNVDEPTAATIMAIVSHQSGIDLNRLNFKSISLIDEESQGKDTK